MKTKIIHHHISRENISWREFVKFGLPCLSFAGMIISAFQGLASKYPVVFILLLASTLIGLFLEGRTSVAVVTLVKLVSIALLFVGVTLLTENPMFVIAGFTFCIVLLIFVLLKT